MKKQRVYVDTSVIGGCFDNEFAAWSNGLFLDFANDIFQPVISDVVVAEVVDAPDFVQTKFAELLTFEPLVVGLAEEAIELADTYQSRQILTPKFYNDGLHIALATIANVDVLVSWNFKHVVHFNKIRLFNAANLEKGYRRLQIFSPREVTTYEE